MKSKLTALLEVKKIITLLIVAVFCYLSIIGKVSVEQFMTVVMVVVPSYFTQSAIRAAVNEVKSPPQ